MRIFLAGPALLRSPRYHELRAHLMEFLTRLGKDEAMLRAATLTAEQIEFFEKKIRPVLIEKCYSCHSHQAKNPENFQPQISATAQRRPSPASKPRARVDCAFRQKR